MKKLVLLVPVCLLCLLVFTANANASTPSLSKLAKELAALQAKVKSQGTTISAQGARITSLTSQLAVAQNDIDTLQTSIAGVSQSDFDALSAKVTADEGKQATDEATIASQGTSLTTAAPVLALAPYVSVTSGTRYGTKGPNIVFTGANVHIVDGAGTTSDNNGSLTGLGNLIVGYDEQTEGAPAPIMTGSHNIVCGYGNSFSGFGGLIAGGGNTIHGACASVTGGLENGATDDYASVVGGTGNTAENVGAVVSGGEYNTATGFESSVSGGMHNTTSGMYASISGGGSSTTGLSESTEYGWMAGSYHTP